MPDLLVRGIDPEVFDRMRKAADAQGKSLAQTAREALEAHFKDVPDSERALIAGGNCAALYGLS